jgi:hypothetical protein
MYVGTADSKPSRPIIMINQSEILSRSQVQFITLFFGGAQLLRLLPATASKLHEFGADKLIS